MPIIKSKRNTGLGRYKSPANELEGLYKKSKGRATAFYDLARKANYDPFTIDRYFTWRKNKARKRA